MSVLTPQCQILRGCGKRRLNGLIQAQVKTQTNWESTKLEMMNTQFPDFSAGKADASGQYSNPTLQQTYENHGSFQSKVSDN